MIKLSDYVVKKLEEHGVRYVFMLTGGGAMHLNDSFGQSKYISCVFQHHEQACAMAAEGYARISGDVGVINVTTGPGGINALNGVFGAWTDSVPMLIISGQVKRETCMASYPDLCLRQLGDQEVDIRKLATPITKYFAYIDDPISIRYHLERALFLSQNGRHGPCWIDIPVDVQATIINERELPAYNPSEDQIPLVKEKLKIAVKEILELLNKSERPVIMAGKGVRSATAIDLLDEVSSKLNIPLVTSWTGIDVVPSNHPLFCGRPGDVGDRYGNFTVQNADLLLIIGARMSLRQVSYNWPSFARHALKIHVEIDPMESRKPIFKADKLVHADAADFLSEVKIQIEETGFDSEKHTKWLTWCRLRKDRYPVVQSHHYDIKNGFINPYGFLDLLFTILGPEDIVVCGNGAANVMTFQTAFIKKGMRVFCNSGNASMGYDLPASIGAAFAGKRKRVVCITGDGSIQLNIQELQTIRHYNLPLKIFVLNNGGYLSIRTTQHNFFGRLTGESPKSGLSFPDIVKVATAYGIQAVRVAGERYDTCIREILNKDGPYLCELLIDPAQLVEPRLAAQSLENGRIVSAPMEDMFPFLKREELLGNMLIPPVEEK